ncbi:hypothetical protein Tsubulata_048100 [Turnera subulata]|uniref:F-box domain-containing protein n=1 Tax=Turnera subulata TaxID=218843 RepID=A0A9Q0GDF9_9ROSI|nr:hypothetical protein Tsubulata_048100 [Turnera subulata]
MAPRRPQTSPQYSRWSDLPSELLEKIGSCLQNSYIGILRFRAVCSTWRRYSSTPLPPKIQSLTLPPIVYLNNSYQYVLKELAVYSVQPAHLHNTTPLLLKQSLESTDDPVMILKPLNSPLLDDRKHRGLVFDLRDFKVNEMWFDHCLLPRGHDGSRTVNPPEVEVAVSSSLCNIGDDEGLTVVAIVPRLSSSLAVWRMGDKSWTITRDRRFQLFHSVSYFNDKFYAMDSKRNIVVIDCDKDTVNIRQLVAQGNCNEWNPYQILVESLGDIFLVQREFRRQDNIERCVVEKLDEKEGKWVKPSRDDLRASPSH